MSRSRYAAWHYLSALVSTVATALTGLVATPLLLRWLGQEQLGAFRVALEWMGYVIMLETCLGPSMQALLARGVAQEDASGIRRALGVGLRGYLLLTVLMLAVGGLLGLFIGDLVGVRPELSGELGTGWYLGLLALVLVPLSPLRSLVEVRQRGYQLHLVLTVQGLLTVGLSVLLAWAGWGLRGQFLAALVGQLPLPLFLGWQGLREVRRSGLSLRRLEHDAGLWREFLSLNTSFFLITLCARLNLQSDALIASLVLGPAQVVPLLLTLRLVSLVQGQVQAVGNAAWAGLAQLHVQGQKELFRERLVELTRLVSVLGLAALGPVVVFNPLFVSLWVGPELYGGHLMTAVAAANALLQATFSLWTWCFSSTGNVRRLVPMYFTATAVNVGASIGCTFAFGAVGPLLGTLGAFLVVSLWWLPRHLCEVFEVAPRALYHAMLMPLAVGLPHLLALAALARLLRPEGWASLVALMCVGGASYLGLAFAFVFSPEDRARWVGRVRTLVRARAA